MDVEGTKNGLEQLTGFDWECNEGEGSLRPTRFICQLRGLGVTLMVSSSGWGSPSPESWWAGITRIGSNAPYNTACGDDPIELALELLRAYRNELQTLMSIK